MRGGGEGNPGAAAVGSGYFPLTGPVRRVAAARQELLGTVRCPRQVWDGDFGLRRFGDTQRGAWHPECGSQLRLLPPLRWVN